MEEKVLILHGWEGNSKKGFIPELVKTLKEKGYSPVALDLPNTNAPKFEEWFEFAEREIKKFGSNNLNIIGHSMGGLLALKLAEKYKVKELILIAPVASKPSKKYFDSVKKKLTDEELEIYKRYQDREIDVDKIKANSEKIIFIFGKKDTWINEKIRDFYIKKFEDVAEIKILEDYGHMSEDEDIKKLPEVEDLFVKIEKEEETKKEIIETKEIKEQEKPKEKGKKKEEKQKPKKEEAVALGRNLHISKKHGVYICSFIKNKKIDEAINDLEQVIKFKKAVPFKGEIPHRKGKEMMSGRYPIKAAGLFIVVLKGLKGNVIVNGLDPDNTIIYYASASWGSRPMRSDRQRGKRTNIVLKGKEIVAKER